LLSDDNRGGHVHVDLLGVLRLLATALPETDTIERRVVSEAAMKAPGKQTMTRPRRASLTQAFGAVREAGLVRAVRPAKPPSSGA
jgi:hypothetical protein